MTADSQPTPEQMISDFIAGIPMVEFGQHIRNCDAYGRGILANLRDAGYAVVKLPERVDELADDPVTYSGPSSVYYVTTEGIESDSGERWRDSNDAREDAAALIAAADAVERGES